MERLFAGRVVGLFVGVCCLSVSGGWAQTGSRSYPVGRRIEEQNRQTEQYEKDARSPTEGKAVAHDRQLARNAAVQVREDFGRIQAIHNEIVIGMSGGNTLDDNHILGALEGINKSASRLKSNLALPRIDDKKKRRKKPEEMAEVELETSLTVLCGHISSFVTNPLFESSGVLDVELSIKASRELDEIIELSHNLKRKAGRLKHD